MAVYSSQVPLGSPLPGPHPPGPRGRPPDFDDQVAWKWCSRGGLQRQPLPVRQALEQRPGRVRRRVSRRREVCRHRVATMSIAYPDDDVAGLHGNRLSAPGGTSHTSSIEAQRPPRHSAPPALPTSSSTTPMADSATGVPSTLPPPRTVSRLTGDELRTAIQLLVATAPVPEPQRPAMGCSIKWRP